MFSMCSELTPRAPIPDSRIAQFMQPCVQPYMYFIKSSRQRKKLSISYKTGQTLGDNRNFAMTVLVRLFRRGMVQFYKGKKIPLFKSTHQLIQCNAKPRVKSYLKFCTMVTLTLSRGYTHTIKHRSAKPFLHIGKRQLFIQCTDQT